MLNGMQDAELRGQGEHHPHGEVKGNLVIYAYAHPEGLGDLDFRKFLLRKYGIVDRESRRDHLDYLQKYGYLVQELSGDNDYPERWKPSADIQTFKKLWFDRENRIWTHALLADRLKFLSTKHVSKFIAEEIVPAFIDYPVSKTFKGGKIYHELPSRNSSPEDRKDLEQICRWAFSTCPLLVSHIFRPNKHVLLCIAMILHKYLNVPAESAGFSPSDRRDMTDRPQDFRQAFQFVLEDWSRIHFSQEISKELICVLTMVICLFIHLERNREASEAVYRAPEYQKLWERFSESMRNLPVTDTGTGFDAVKVIFTLTFTEELYRQDHPARGRRDRLITV